MNRQELLRGYKQAMRRFMRDHYTDSRLIQLLDHARSGKLSFISCCCFVGIATADHADGKLRGAGIVLSHLAIARELSGAYEAERAFNHFGHSIVPMVLAEIKRRQHVATARVLEPQESALLQA